MVFYLEKNNDIYFGFFLSPLELISSRGKEERIPDATASHVVSIKLAYQKSLLKHWTNLEEA